MLDKRMTKSEMERALKEKGDFVQIDWLGRLVEQSKGDLPTDVKKFVYQKMADIYEQRGMITDSAKMYENLAVASMTFSDKMKYYVKSAELLIKAGKFDWADEAMKKSFIEANEKDRLQIIMQIKEFYKKQALQYEKDMRRSNSVKLYERLLQMNLSESERKETKAKLMTLYENLGMIKELKEMDGSRFVASERKRYNQF